MKCGEFGAARSMGWRRGGERAEGSFASDVARYSFGFVRDAVIGKQLYLLGSSCSSLVSLRRERRERRRVEAARSCSGRED